MAAGDAGALIALQEKYQDDLSALLIAGDSAGASALYGLLFPGDTSSIQARTVFFNLVPHIRIDASEASFYGAAVRQEGGELFVPQSVWQSVVQADYDTRHGGSFTRQVSGVLENLPVILGAALVTAGATGALDAFAVSAASPAAPVISLAPAAPAAPASFSPVAAGTGLETVSFIPPGTFELGGQFAGVTAPSAAGGALTASELAIFGLTAPTVGPLAVTAGATVGAGVGSFLGLSSVPLPSLGQAVTAGKAVIGAATAAGAIGGGGAGPQLGPPGTVPVDAGGATTGEKITAGLALAAFAAILYFSFR